MKLNEFYNQVSRCTDTCKTEITVAVTKRVLSEAFLILAKMDSTECSDTIAKGLATAQKKMAK